MSPEICPLLRETVSDLYKDNIRPTEITVTNTTARITFSYVWKQIFRGANAFFTVMENSSGCYNKHNDFSKDRWPNKCNGVFTGTELIAMATLKTSSASIWLLATLQKWERNDVQLKISPWQRHLKRILRCRRRSFDMMNSLVNLLEI